MDNAHIGWWIADLKSRTYTCSDFVSQLLGLDDTHTISFHEFNKRILKEDHNHTVSLSFHELQQTIEEVYLLDTPQGNIWIRSKISYQETDEEGNVKIYGISETQDGPQVVSAYQALQNSERILHNIYKNLPVGIELYDKNGNLSDLNKKELEMFHISSKENILGVNLFKNPVLPEEIKQKLRDHEDADFTYRYDFSKINGYYKSGITTGSIDLMTRITTLYDHDHQLTNYLLINVDQTENTIAYNKIKEFKSFFDLIGNYAKVGYALFDVKSRKGYALDSWYHNMGEKKGTTLSEIIGIYSHFHPEDQAHLLSYFPEILNGKKNHISTDVRICREDGKYTWTRINIMVRDYRPQDNVIEMICINFDITELKETEQKLIKAKNKAEESDRLKSSFLANMSHEIRTPLNAIVGFSSMLLETSDEEEKSEYINIIEENNQLLLQLISDILDLSKIEAGTFDMIMEKIDARQLCHELVQTMQLKTKPNVELQLAPNLPELSFITDKNRVRQVLLNFITNALKFTMEGNITINYQTDGKSAKFFVQDTGIGIAPDKQKSIFNRFIKLNNFISGTGLGLSICQSIITQLGGELGVESELGKGACFWFTHPLN